MRKRILSMLLAVCMVLGFAPTTVWADSCVFDRPDGTVEVWGVISYYYTVGEPFRAKDIGLNYHKHDGVQYYGDNLEFWANGNPIQDGYKFKEVGEKTITVKRGNWTASYQLQVSPVLNGSLKDCAIVKQPAKTTYRQGVDGFDPKDIVVQCTFTDGSTQNLGYQDLELYAGSRGMRDFKDGVFIKDGYRFKEAGEKDLIIRVCNKQMRIPFTVTQVLAKDIEKVEMVQDPAATSYRVGEAFCMDEYSAQCFYTDGTIENFDGKALTITANGTKMYDGYHFKEAGTKKVVVRLGDYETTYSMEVSK
ncbi:MAG: hypothetical protein RR685_04945 [Hungatella sp.]